MIDWMPDVAVAAVSLTVVSFYVWSLRGHFDSPVMPTGAKFISALVTSTTVFFLYLLWAVSQPQFPQWIGMVIEIAAAVLFWWAVSASRKARLRFAFDEQKPHGLVTEGPYRYLRHPFYTSYLVFWSGWALATWSAWALLPLMVFVVVYVVVARREEQLFSATPMAEEYESYRSRTGFMLPWI